MEQQIALDEQFAEIAFPRAGHPTDEEVWVLQRTVPGIEQHWFVRLAHAHQHAARHGERVGEEREHGGERGRIQRERAQQLVAGLWQARLEDLGLLKGGEVCRRIQREQGQDSVEAFHPLSQRFAAAGPQQEIEAQVKYPFLVARQVVQQARDILLGHQRIGIVRAALAPVEAAA